MCRVATCWSTGPSEGCPWNRAQASQERRGARWEKCEQRQEAQAPSGDQKPENPGPRKEPLSPASNRVKKAEKIARVWAGGQVIAVDCPVSVVASEMTKDALFDASTYARRTPRNKRLERTTRLSPSTNPSSPSAPPRFQEGGQDDRSERTTWTNTLRQARRRRSEKKKKSKEVRRRKTRSDHSVPPRLEMEGDQQPLPWIYSNGPPWKRMPWLECPNAGAADGSEPESNVDGEVTGAQKGWFDW